MKIQGLIDKVSTALLSLAITAMNKMTGISDCS